MDRLWKKVENGMPSNKQVFTLRLEEAVFDEIGRPAAKQHRSMTNDIEYVLLERIQQEQKLENASANSGELDRPVGRQ